MTDDELKRLREHAGTLSAKLADAEHDHYAMHFAVERIASGDEADPRALCREVLAILRQSATKARQTAAAQNDAATAGAITGKKR